MMKTHEVLLLAVGVSGALSLSAQAGSHAGYSGGAHASAHPAPAAFHSAPAFRFSNGRMIAPSQRFSAIGMRPMRTSTRLLGQHYAYSSRNASIGRRQFTSGTFRRSRDFGVIGNNQKTRAGSIGRNSGSRGLAGRNNHVFAQRSANWHRDWNRRSDHWWHGHRCRFVNGSWFIFDFGFLPWYGWPYDYSGYDYYPYPYGYDPGIYEGVDSNYYGEENYYPSDQSTDSIVAAAQERLAREGYYEGEIDGVLSAETRRAVIRYQGDRSLRVTGYLSSETLQSLGLRQTARY
jgi:Putative peptidoglycan binding domain